jgi:hypothetical protein
LGSWAPGSWRIHTDDARRKPSECLNQCQSLDLTTKSNLAVRAKANGLEDFLADIDADRGKAGMVDSKSCFSGCGVVFAEYPRGEAPDIGRIVWAESFAPSRSPPRGKALGLKPHCIGWFHVSSAATWIYPAEPAVDPLAASGL